MKDEEEIIRKLFQQLRHEDEHSVPTFAHYWQVALARLEKPRPSWSALRFAAGAAVLILFVAGSWLYLRQSTKQQPTPIGIVSSDWSAPGPTPKSFSQPPLLVKNPPIVTRRHRPVVRRQPPSILISHWRSPTESLLRIPGEQLFKRVPRLDESLVNIKATIPDQKN